MVAARVLSGGQSNIHIAQVLPVLAHRSLSRSYLRLHRRFKEGEAVSIYECIFCWMVGEECDLPVASA